MKTTFLAALATASCVSLSLAATAAGSPGQRPADRKAREILEKAISIPTQLGNDKVPELAEYLASQFRAGGFPAEDVRVTRFDFPDDKTATLTVRYRGDGSGGKPIVLMAHMDVVTANRADWQRDPYTMVEQGGYFFGRGSYDNKAGLVGITSAVLRLKAEGFRPRRDLIVYFSGDEETSQRTTVAMLRDHRDLVDAEFALNSDAGGGALDDDNGKPLYYSLQAAEKTYADFTFTVHNPGGHSSLPRSDNAIYELAAALGRVQAWQFPVMTNDITLASLRAAGRTTPGALGAAMRQFASDPRDAAAAAVISADPAYVGWLRTTCVATRLAGGHANNALPQSATANVNCRIFPGVQPDAVRDRLQQLAGKGVDVKYALEVMSSDASPLRADVVDAVTRTVHALHPGVPVVPNQAAGATDGLVFRANGIPTYGVDGLFMRHADDFSHGLDERILIESFYDSLEHWYLLLEDLAGQRRAR
ncbi:MAG TPA: M20/M25/M40 family metallo-hydrolase [Steroidobacteraceae bacterium]|nr:M20/M25/M40 family metallo-hydrolase [Steroidobacteraceae bacterium]